MSEEEVGSAEPAEELPEVTEGDASVADAAPVDTGDVEEQSPSDAWHSFRSMPEFAGQEDQAIASRLYEAMQREQAASRALQQYQSIVPVAQDWLAHREEYEQWKSSRNQAPPPAAQQQPQEPPWWNPPDLKDSYRRYLTRDENGQQVISPDAPLDARAALEDHMQYRADFAQKFLDNPEQTLGPMVERMAVERAESIVDSRLQRMKDEQYVSSLEESNKDWLYDENGNVSSEGLLAQKYIADAKRVGIVGAEARWDYATKMIERDLAISRLQQGFAPQQAMPQAPQQPPPPQQPSAEQQNMEFLRRQAMRTASQRQTAGSTDARTPKRPMTFEERLLSAAKEQGMLQ